MVTRKCIAETYLYGDTRYYELLHFIVNEDDYAEDLCTRHIHFKRRASIDIGKYGIRMGIGFFLSVLRCVFRFAYSSSYSAQVATCNCNDHETKNQERNKSWSSMHLDFSGNIHEIFRLEQFRSVA